MSKLLVIIIYIFISKINASRILAVFPTPSISHQVVFRPLTQELARRGHEVIVITPNPVFDKGKAPENLIEIDVHDISYKKIREFLTEDNEYGRKFTFEENIHYSFKVFAELFEEQIKTKDVQNIIKNKEIKFDLLLLEACVRSTLVFSHLYNVPVIQISSFGMMLGSDEIVGAPTHPLLYPSALHQRVYNLSFFEKLEVIYKHMKMMSKYDDSEILEHKQFQEIVGSDLPTFNVLKNNIDMLFLNIHPIWTDSQPLPTNVISIWGIHKKTQTELPQDLKTYLDSSKAGIIYFSFGSNVQSSLLPPEFIQIFVRVFSQLPYNVLWKWEKDELPRMPQNVRISKWFPQTDILRHPNVKLFITQGGLQSTEEALNGGVPLIGIPMSGDQFYNVEKYLRRKIGIKLDFNTMNEEGLMTAIETIMKDKSYRENAAKLGVLLNDQPQSALDRAVWWTEYVLRHGEAKHLRTPAANMSWMEYYEIQFILTLLFIILISIFVFVVFVCLLWKYVLRNFTLTALKMKTA